MQNNDYTSDNHITQEYIRNIKGTRRLLYNIVDIMSQQERTLRTLMINDSHNRNNNNRYMREFNNISSQQNTQEANRQRFYSEMDEPMTWINTPRITITTPQSVRSVPTREEINRATNEVRFSSIRNPLNNVCPISRESFSPNDLVTQIRPCGHIFSRENLNIWFTSSVHCPMCRYDIRRRRTQNTSSASATSASATSGVTRSATTSRTTSSSAGASNSSVSSPRRNTSANRETIDNFANLITHDILRQLNTNARDTSNNLLFEYTLMTPQNNSRDDVLDENVSN